MCIFMTETEMNKEVIAPEVPVGTISELMFLKADWVTKPHPEKPRTKIVTGVKLNFEGYQPIFLYCSKKTGQLDFQFANLLSQLGITGTYNIDEVNAHAGTVIKCSRYVNGNYINTNFNLKTIR